MTSSPTTESAAIVSVTLSIAARDLSITSVVPYERGSAPMPPYNSSAMYEDSMLPVYVDYIGNIMPILDRQSISTNWPPTPHPLTGQVRYVPFNITNLPTVPYMLNIGSQLLPNPIRGTPAFSDVAFGVQPELKDESVSQVNVNVTQIPTTVATSFVTFLPIVNSTLLSTLPYISNKYIGNVKMVSDKPKGDTKLPLIKKDTTPVGSVKQMDSSHPMSVKPPGH